jgi:hypothetical protein
MPQLRWRRFRSEVVDNLLAAGAHPLDRSKTELGTNASERCRDRGSEDGGLHGCRGDASIHDPLVRAGHHHSPCEG